MNNIASAEHKRKEMPLSIFVFYTIVTSAIYILPNTKLTVPYIFSGSLMLLSLPIIMLLDKKCLNYGSILLAASCYFLLANILIYPVITDGINEVIRNIRFFIPIVWGVYGIKFANGRQKKVIVLLFFLLTAYILYNTMVALEEDPWIARILAQEQSTSTDEVNAYRLGNVGGYPFSYMMGVIAIMITSLTLKTKKTFGRIIGVALIILIYVYIIQTMYTTLLLLTTVACLLLLFLHVKNPILKIAIVLVFVLAAVGLIPLLEFIRDLFDSESLLVTKFDQIIDSLTGEGVDALGRRPELMEKALNNWIESPIIGSYHTTASHSLYMEYLQLNGIVGLALWIILYVASWKLILSELKLANVDTTTYNVAMTYFTVLSFLNDTKWTFDINIAAFFIAPVFCCVFFKKKDTHNRAIEH